MLQEDHFLVDGARIVEEVVGSDYVLLCNFILVDVIKME